MRRCLLLFLPLLWSGAASAADIVDATGRTVHLPDQIAHVLPSGPPAAVLLAALAPDLMVGWPSPLSEDARGMLSSDAAKLPQIPRLTGREDVTEKIKALNPDLILDYGDVTPRYSELAAATQRKTAIPTLLFNGSLDEIPRVIRTLGAILHRENRATAMASFAETLLVPPPSRRSYNRVLYARGSDGLSVAAPGAEATEVFARLGWRVIAPDGPGTFRTTNIDTIRALDPDILIFGDPSMRQSVARDGPWQAVRAVREGHAFVAPAVPFGWIEEPPSINRLLGLAWLGGQEPESLTATFNAVIYGHVLTPSQRDAVLGGIRSMQP